MRVSRLKDAVNILGSLERLEAFMEEHQDMRERVQVINPARQMLRKSSFRNYSLLLDAPFYLTFEYWELKVKRATDEEAYARHIQRMHDLKLVLVPHPEEDIKRYGGTTHHLKNSNLDDRWQLRVYFSWNEKKKKIIINGMPDHWDDGTR